MVIFPGVQVLDAAFTGRPIAAGELFAAREHADAAPVAGCPERLRSWPGPITSVGGDAGRDAKRCRQFADPDGNHGVPHEAVPGAGQADQPVAPCPSRPGKRIRRRPPYRRRAAQGPDDDRGRAEAHTMRFPGEPERFAMPA